MSRRDILRRSAVVGGTAAALWAAPQLTTRAMAAAACDGTPECFCGVYATATSPTSWDASCGSMPSTCSSVLNTGLPAGYAFTINTTATTVEVVLDKIDGSACGWEFSSACLYLSCAAEPDSTALTGSPCKRTVTFTWTGGVPSNIEDCFEMYFVLCGCTDT